MRKFSLSSKIKAFPDTYEVDGNTFSIYTDYRRILRILRLLDDPNVLDTDKHIVMMTLFFKDKIPPEPYEAFKWFVSCGIERESSGEKDFDFEQDACEIYAAFMQLYGIDLIETDMHYWRFSMLLDGIFSTENALSNKVHLRHMDDSKSKRDSAIARAKRNAAVSSTISGATASLENLIRERIQAGKPINDLLGGVNGD